MAPKKIQIPDINRYSEFRSFLDDFFTINKELNKNFSYRYLARKLGWSSSHLNDVMQGRRFLSLAKLVELIDFLGLKGVRAERLLLLALFESNGITPKGKDFLAVQNSSFNIKTMSKNEVHLMQDEQYGNLLHYIICEDGVWNADDFIRRSRKSKELSKPKLTEMIQNLEREGFIRWNENKTKYIVEKTDFYLDTSAQDEDFLRLQKSFAKTYQDFTEDRFPSWLDLFGSVMIPRDRLPEVFDRMAGLRNFLYEIRKQSLEQDPQTKFEVFNFSLSLFSIFRRRTEIPK